jgi:hypothetical protein
VTTARQLLGQKPQTVCTIHPAATVFDVTFSNQKGRRMEGGFHVE